MNIQQIKNIFQIPKLHMQSGRVLEISQTGEIQLL